jgi:DNA-binding winged helix-turn-helix (wHTH) protein
MKRSIERDDGFYQFGPFYLDAGERVLLRDGRIVPLAPKALSTLLVLVRNMGHVVEKDVLMAEVWPDEVVEEGNLAQHVFMLRKALGENTNYIETVPRRGYRFRELTSGVDRPSKHYMDNAEAYQAYLNARHSWSKHTTNGLKEAIGYFLQAIDLEPDSALAYAGLVDCYLRLATNYLPPTDALPESALAIRVRETAEMPPERKSSIEIRCDWDREIANRECRRTDELKLHYPTVKQWRAAYGFALHFYNQSLMKMERALPSTSLDLTLPRFQSASLTPDEEVQILCIIARDQIDTGNYDAACAVLERWWTIGEWPKLDRLNSRVSADLLLTVGGLAGLTSSARQVPRGQKQAEALLNGAIGLFEQLGFRTLSAEGRIELALCYEREGIFDFARTTFLPAIEVLLSGNGEIRRSALLRLAKVEWQAGRLHVALERLHEADEIVEAPSLLHTGQYHNLLAAILQTLTTPGPNNNSVDKALQHCLKDIDQWEAIGNHRHVAMGENNHGYLLVTLGRLDEAETHMVRARKLFDALDDKRRCAQVDDSLAHLHLAAERFELAEQAAGRAVRILETGLEGYLADSLTTQGLVLCKLGRHREARRVLDRAYQVAERCGNSESACAALLTVIEQMGPHLGEDEILELIGQLDRFLASSQNASTVERIKKCRELAVQFTHLL